jgi:hypothetical protein
MLWMVCWRTGCRGRAASGDHDALVLGIVRGSRLEEDGPLEGAAVQQAGWRSSINGTICECVCANRAL